MAAYLLQITGAASEGLFRPQKPQAFGALHLADPPTLLGDFHGALPFPNHICLEQTIPCLSPFPKDQQGREVATWHI